MTPLRTTALLCTLVLAIALAACGEEGDDPGEVVADEPPAEAEPTSEDEPPEPADEEPAEEEPADEEPADDDAPATTGPYTVTYRIEDPETGSEEITYAVDGDDVAMLADDNGQELWTIFRDDTMTTCFGGEGDWQCVQGPADGAGADPFAMTAGLGGLMPGADDPLADEVWESQEAETIAGRAATCAKADASMGMLGEEPGGEVEVCVDDETGATLRLMITDEDGAAGGMTVTAFEPAADPTLFEYPAEPMVIGED